MKYIKTILLAGLLLVVQQGTSQVTDQFFVKAHSFFKSYVSNGRVNYKAVKENPEALQEALQLAKTIRIAPDKAKTYQAFWINTYNLLVIEGIVAAYPVKSPLAINGFFDGKKHEVGGENITLNAIENELLRKNFKEEARFHFVLVCAGLGCPPIINKAYLPSTLESQLQEQTVLALNNPSFIQLKGKKVLLSQIFEWYKEDFTRNGDEIDFINRFRKEPLDPKTKVGYYPYDWTLNDTK